MRSLTVVDICMFQELKISRIEGKQDLTNLGVKKLCDYAYSMENNTLRENIQAPQASSQLPSSSRIGALPPPSCEPSSSASNRSFLRSNGISGAFEVTPNPGTSDGFHSPVEAINGSAVLLRTRSATTTVLHRIGSRG
uniref:Uncharacterized protein LOC105123035 isoform X3 n=1 Tax=Rhizophora mucronata TaxID=61149 RepID=A0A2P2MLW3_RHIMU